ncbi:MAG TPA: hypothetical protein DGR79_06615 [Clostridiales bacterium]|nr:hypothetical protein [Clostridiales bacterium]
MVAVVGLSQAAMVLLNLLRLTFSMTAAEFGHFSFGVQGASAAIASIIAAGTAMALTTIDRKTGASR